MLAGVSGDWCSSGNFIVSRGTHVCNGESSMPSGVKPDELDFENGISGALGDQLQVRESVRAKNLAVVLLLIWFRLGVYVRVQQLLFRQVQW